MQAAQIVSIPSSFYDTLADIKGSPIGPRLREVCMELVDLHQG